MKDIKDFLEQARKSAIKAGAAILSVYDSGDFDVSIKGDNSPLTRADKAAHAIIAEDLKATGLPILSEEGRQIPYEERKTWEWFWLVDPLDGTKEFIKRNGEFTVNIALMQGHVPVAGVIFSPSLDILYHGSAETGVYKTAKNVAVRLSPAIKKNDLDELQQKDLITIVASKSHLNEETTAFINRFPNRELTSMGSSFKLMLLAEGAADIYPRLAPTMEWDTAAGHALLRALNKAIYQTDLKSELVYNKADLLNPSFIAF